MFRSCYSKLYVSRHVIFLEYIPFFSIPSTTHDMTMYDLIRTNPFSEDSNNFHLGFLVLHIALLMLFLIVLSHHTQHVVTNSFEGTNTFLFRASETPSSLMVPQSLFEIIDPPLHPSTHICKSIKLPYFSYSYYICYFLFSFYTLFFLAFL